MTTKTQIKRAKREAKKSNAKAAPVVVAQIQDNNTVSLLKKACIAGASVLANVGKAAQAAVSAYTAGGNIKERQAAIKALYAPVITGKAARVIRENFGDWLLVYLQPDTKFVVEAKTEKNGEVTKTADQAQTHSELKKAAQAIREGNRKLFPKSGNSGKTLVKGSAGGEIKNSTAAELAKRVLALTGPEFGKFRAALLKGGYAVEPKQVSQHAEKARKLAADVTPKRVPAPAELPGTALAAALTKANEANARAAAQ